VTRATTAAASVRGVDVERLVQHAVRRSCERANAPFVAVLDEQLDFARRAEAVDQWP
jgi:hypothetical protein